MSGGGPRWHCGGPGPLASTPHPSRAHGPRLAAHGPSPASSRLHRAGSGTLLPSLLGSSPNLLSRTLAHLPGRGDRVSSASLDFPSAPPYLGCDRDVRGDRHSPEQQEGRGWPATFMLPARPTARALTCGLGVGRCNDVHRWGRLGEEALSPAQGWAGRGLCPQGPLCPPEDSSHLGQQVPDAEGHLWGTGQTGGPTQPQLLSSSAQGSLQHLGERQAQAGLAGKRPLGLCSVPVQQAAGSTGTGAPQLGPSAGSGTTIPTDHRDPHILCASPCLSLSLPHCPEHCWVSGGLTTSWTHTLIVVAVPPSTLYSAWSPGARRKQPRSCPSEGSRGGCPRAGPVWGRQDEKAQWTQWTQGQQHLLELEEVGPFHARSACLGHRGKGSGDNLWPVWPQPPGRGQGQPPGVQVSERSWRSGCRGPGCARRAARDCRAWVGAPRPAAGPRGHRAQELPSEEALHGGQ